MPRFVAFLRGVSPLNAKMPELKRCFETAGFSEVRTLLSSGNVVFSSRTASPNALARRACRKGYVRRARPKLLRVRPACSVAYASLSLDEKIARWAGVEG